MKNNSIKDFKLFITTKRRIIVELSSKQVSKEASEQSSGAKQAGAKLAQTLKAIMLDVTSARGKATHTCGDGKLLRITYNEAALMMQLHPDKDRDKALSTRPGGTKRPDGLSAQKAIERPYGQSALPVATMKPRGGKG